MKQKVVYPSELYRDEQRGCILNLNSCREEGLFIPGSVVVVIVPHSIIPVNGFCPDKEVHIADKQPREFETPPAEKFFDQRSLSSCAAVSCLLTRAGTLLPYVPKEHLAGLVEMLYS